MRASGTAPHGAEGQTRIKPLIKGELDVSLSLSKYIELHGETRKVVRGCEMGYVCVGLKFTKKRCEMQWPASLKRPSRRRPLDSRT